MGGHIPYEENHRIIDGVLEKKCNHHNELFPNENPWMPCTEEYYYKNSSSSSDGLNTWCRKCAKKKSLKNRWDNIDRSRESSKNWNRKNPEVINKANKSYRTNKHLEKQEYQKEYYKQNTPKLKVYNEKRNKKNHTITVEEWENCKKYFNHRCCYCGLAIEENYRTYRGIRKLADFDKEHYDDEGANDLSNCLPSCGSCNSKKWKFDFGDWYNESNPVFDMERYNKIMKWLDNDYKEYINN